MPELGRPSAAQCPPPAAAVSDRTNSSSTGSPSESKSGGGQSGPTQATHPHFVGLTPYLPAERLGSAQKRALLQAQQHRGQRLLRRPLLASRFCERSQLNARVLLHVPDQCAHSCRHDIDRCEGCTLPMEYAPIRKSVCGSLACSSRTTSTMRAMHSACSAPTDVVRRRQGVVECSVGLRFCCVFVVLQGKAHERTERTQTAIRFKLASLGRQACILAAGRVVPGHDTPSRGASDSAHLRLVRVPGVAVGGVQVQVVQRLAGERRVVGHAVLPPHIAAVQDTCERLGAQAGGCAHVALQLLLQTC